MNVLQRAVWHGEPYRLEDLFLLIKNEHRAVCEVWTHWAGWELRLIVDAADPVQTQVCRGEQDVMNVRDNWQSKLLAKGWTRCQ